jgi:hypothetical protein
MQVGMGWGSAEAGGSFLPSHASRPRHALPSPPFYFFFPKKKSVSEDPRLANRLRSMVSPLLCFQFALAVPILLVLPTAEAWTCACDPAAADVSHTEAPNWQQYTQCEVQPGSQHMKIAHLAPRFHTVPFRGGEKHVCKMIGPNDCRCCFCVPPDQRQKLEKLAKKAPAVFHARVGATTVQALSEGYMTRWPYLGKGSHNKVGSLGACQQKCVETNECKAGTFITGGPRHGECWLSAHVLAKPGQCVQQNPCSGFTVKAV